METSKKYLVLEFSDAGMLLEWNVSNPSVKKICELENIKSGVFCGHNVGVPIPYTTLSNMLAKLMGCVPVPTKPKKRQRMLHNYTRLPICDEMAKSAYIKINGNIIPDNPISKCYIGFDGDYYYVANHEAKLFNKGELIKGEKTAMDSNVTNTTVLFNFDNGDPKRLNGIFNFQMLSRFFEYNTSNPTFTKLIGFINNLLGCDDVFKKYTFNGMAEAIYHIQKNNPEVQANIVSFIQSIKDEWIYNKFDIWMDAIFNYWPNKKVFHSNASTLNKTSNCSNSVKPDGHITLSRSYIINRRDIDHREVKISGEIIVEVTDGRVIDMIKENSGVCSCLEGGICKVVGLYNWEPIPNYKEDWDKIYNENALQYIDLNQVV